MAEFQEVIRQKNRMCQSVLCCKCDIYLMCGQELSECPQFISNNPKKAEEVIMAWAKENPEPVYPLWGEWLVSIGAAHNAPTGIPFQTADGRIIDPPWEICVDLYEPIPADIAQKLGIRPKGESK